MTTPTPTTESPEVKHLKHRFTLNTINGTYIFKNGKVAHFFSGVYHTDVQSEIDELNNEVALGHPHIGVDADKKVIDVADLDPVAMIKKKAIEEYKASVAAATDKGRDMGQTESGRILGGIANSETVGAAAAGSDSNAPGNLTAGAAGTAGVGTARLTNLLKK